LLGVTHFAFPRVADGDDALLIVKTKNGSGVRAVEMGSCLRARSKARARRQILLVVTKRRAARSFPINRATLGGNPDERGGVGAEAGCGCRRDDHLQPGRGGHIGHSGRRQRMNIKGRINGDPMRSVNSPRPRMVRGFGFLVDAFAPLEFAQNMEKPHIRTRLALGRADTDT